MIIENLKLLYTYSIFVVLLLVAGFYFILATRNLIRILLGIELLTKAVTLFIIIVGYVTNNIALAQTLVIIIIIIEVFVIAVLVSIVNRIYRHTDSLSIKNIMSMKG
jgi:NADH:ubiquinone oxidoreductase subunit K